MTMTHVPVTSLLSPLKAPTDALLPAVGTAPVRRSAAPAAPRSQVPIIDLVEEWGLGSFPASDPPSNW